jgi:hypothetical protein
MARAAVNNALMQQSATVVLASALVGVGLELGLCDCRPLCGEAATGVQPRWLSFGRMGPCVPGVRLGWWRPGSQQWDLSVAVAISLIVMWSLAVQLGQPGARVVASRGSSGRLTAFDECSMRQ